MCYVFDMSETPATGDERVLAYLAAIEARRSAPDTLPHPDEISAALAGGEMVHGDENAGELTDQLAAFTPGAEKSIERLEDGFVAEAADYARRHHVSYRGWIEAGVDPAVLERAGITPEPADEG